jgi:5'(3')-deoxyribonucleotidase
MVILLDVDGVLADFTGAVLRVGNKFSGMQKTHEDVTMWDIWKVFPDRCKEDILKEVSSAGFCSGLECLPHAKKMVSNLREMGDVYAVTSPWHSSPTWCWERTLWLLEHFGFEANQVVHTHEKRLVRGDVLIDDRVETIKAWDAEVGNILGILWDAPYNRSEKVHWRVKDWDELKFILDEFWGKNHAGRRRGKK